MRKLFTLCLLVFSLSVSAQWQQTGSKVRYVNGLGIPTRDTAAGVAADSSQILIRPADSSLYVKYKRTWQRVGSGGTIGGSGTANRVAKFTASTTIGNSQITDNGTSVGINQTSPIYQLHVTSGGNAVVFTNAGVSSVIAATNAAATISAMLSLRGDTISLSGGGINSSPLMTINSSNVGIGTTSPAAKFVVSNAGASGLEVNPTGGVSSGVLLQAYNRSTSAYMAQSYYALGHTFNVGTAAATRALDISSAGNTLVGTAVDNGVDRLQVSGGLNVSAKATAQNLSVTNSAQITNNLDMGSGTANTNLTMLANGTSSGWAGRMVGEYSTGQFYFQHRNNTPTWTTCFSLNANGGKGGTTFYDNAFITGDGWLTVNGGSNNGVDKLQVVGSASMTGMKQAYLARTTTYTATTSDYLIDCTSGTFTVNLFAASGNAGRIIIVKNSGAGTITVDGNASETIDGATTYSLATQYATVQIMSDGTNWKIIAKF